MASNLLQQINNLLSDTSDNYKLNDNERSFLEKVRNELICYSTEAMRLRAVNNSLCRQLDTNSNKTM